MIDIMIIYKITNLINNKSYIGLTLKDVTKRVAEHIYTKYPLGKSLRKYGLQSFNISIIDSAETISDLYEKERYWIKLYDCKNPNGYNLTDGGDGKLGFKASEETRQKMSKDRMGRIPWNKGLTKETDKRIIPRKPTKEHKEKIRQSLLGHKVTEETKRKIRETKKCTIYNKKII